MVTRKILDDPAELLRWFDQAAASAEFLQPTQADRINVVALAYRVLRDTSVKNPVKVFVANVRDRNYRITNAEEDHAVAVIKAIDRGKPKPRISDLSDNTSTRGEQLKRLSKWQENRK